jgi:hypothetical protein
VQDWANSGELSWYAELVEARAMDGLRSMR